MPPLNRTTVSVGTVIIIQSCISRLVDSGRHYFAWRCQAGGEGVLSARMCSCRVQDMPDAQTHLWITMVGSFGVGRFVGNRVSHWLTSNQQRENWLKDNKKLEWRELIDQLNEVTTRMRFEFPPVVSDCHTLPPMSM